MDRCNPHLLKVQEPFRSLFATPDMVRKAVLADMKTRGYDPAFPIIVWNRVVIDGHTRVSVAKQLGVDVNYVEKNFNSLTGALHYALHCQKDRRNISPEALLRAVDLVDVEEKALAKERQKEHSGTAPGTPKHLRPKERKFAAGESAEKTGEALGISSTQVKRIRAINDPETPIEIKEKVKKGEVSISFDNSRRCVFRGWGCEMKEDQITVKEIVKRYLIKHGYDGLYSDLLECGCPLDDLMQCDGSPYDCRPGFRVEDPSGEFEFLIVPKLDSETS